MYSPSETEKAEKRIRAIEQLVGFIGVGQVVFAILQLIGAERILGENCANSRFVATTSQIVSILFFCLIVENVLFASNREIREGQ